MEDKNKDFVLNNLSNKSSSYILNDLFKDTTRIEAEMLSLDSYDKKDTFIIGQLDESDYELYIVMESLSRRIKGTRERMDYMYTDNDSPKDDVELFSQRSIRLKELQSDWEKIRNFLYVAIETRFNKEIHEIFEVQPSLLKERRHWSNYNDYAGYIFIFLQQKFLGITNYYPIGGD